MPALAGFKVEGQRELIRALSAVSAETKKGMRAELEKVAQPVKPVATQFAQANIRNIGDGRWSEFKIGVTQKAVYVAPKARRAGGSPRKNLAGLLLKQAMWPAVKAKEPEIRESFSVWLDSVNARHGLL